jgi:hypothetical protein
VQSPIIDIQLDADSTIWMLSSNNTLYKIKDQRQTEYRLPSSPYRAQSITLFQNRVYIGLGNTIYTINKHKQLVKAPHQPDGQEAIVIKKILFTSLHEMWLLQAHKPVIRISLKDGSLIQHPFLNNDDFWQNNQWNDIVEHKGTIWLIGWMPKSFGITYYDAQKQLFVDLAETKRNNTALFVGDFYNKMATTKNQNLLMSAYGGWNRLTDQGVILKRVDVLHYPILSDKIMGIVESENGDIFFGTTEGLYCYHVKDDYVSLISEADGLVSNDASLAFTLLPNNILALGNNGGVTLINLDAVLESRLLQRFAFSEIRKDSIAVSANELILFEPNNTTLDIKFSALTYCNQNQIRYRYKFSTDQEWIPLGTVSSLKLNHLPYGTYDILVQAGDHLGNWQFSTNVLHIKSVPPFVKSIPFYALVLVLLSISTLLIIRYFILKNKKETQIQRQLLYSEMSALRAQMNPHFVFNSLNAIKSFIILQKTDQAESYLNTFSKLLRYILEYSKESRITIEKELQAIKMYMDLEVARLEDAFEYTISVNNTIDITNTYLPPMLIQPYLENAIWHGIRSISYKGKIALKLSLIDDGVIKIEIQDNGIGIQNAQQLKPKVTRKHLGMSITAERLKLLNPNNSITIKDLAQFNTGDKGTRVILLLYPQQAYSEYEY